jgi:hypothetical protein
VAEAAEMLGIEVDHEKGVYTMRSEVWIDATVEQVYEIFRYWDYSSEFSSAIVESRDVEPDAEGRPQFYVRNKGCVLFFCTSFERRGYVEAEPNKVIFAFVVPETSDFHLSNESWRFEQRNGGTVVTYDLEMKPKFWIPPGIGPYLIKRKLRNSGGDAIDRIETMARAVVRE